MQYLRNLNQELYLVVSVLVLHVLSHKSHGVDCLLQVRLLFKLTRSAVAETRVESGVEVVMNDSGCEYYLYELPLL